MSLFQYHIFVCEHEREPNHPKGSCKGRGSAALLDAFREEVSRMGLAPVCRVNKAGCLGLCRVGPTVVIYPQGIWYGGVAPEDVPEIVKALSQGEVVERLKA